MNAVVEDLEKDGEKLLRFMASNHLVANPSKTGLLIIRAKGSPQARRCVRLDGTVIQESESQRVLGMTLNNNLSWNEHIYGKGGLVSSLHQKLGALRRLSFHVPTQYMTTIAKATLVSKVRYGLGIYGTVRLSNDEPRKSIMDDLQVILNNTMRLLLNKKIADKVRIEELCQKTTIMPINRMAAEEHIRIIRSATHDEKSPLQDLFNLPIHRSTRAATRGDISTSARTSLATRNVPHTAIRTWNSTDVLLRNTINAKNAKTLTRSFVESLPL